MCAVLDNAVKLRICLNCHGEGCCHVAKNVHSKYVLLSVLLLTKLGSEFVSQYRDRSNPFQPLHVSVRTIRQ